MDNNDVCIHCGSNEVYRARLREVKFSPVNSSLLEDYITPTIRLRYCSGCTNVWEVDEKGGTLW